MSRHATSIIVNFKSYMNKKGQIMNESKMCIWSTVCFIIACIIMIPILFQFTPEGRFPVGTQAHQIFKSFWWACSLITLVFLCVKKILNNIIGTIMVLCLGPITLMTIGLFYALKKLKVIKL